ncbi:RmlC-like cupin domain-containing protein [Trichoderma compactum]
MHLVTDSAVNEKYSYHEGSEAVPGAVPIPNNHPQRPPLGLRTEKMSGTSLNHHLEYANPPPAKNLTPNAMSWPAVPWPEKGDWISQRLVGSNGDPQQKTGLATWFFNVHKDMDPQTVFSSPDGEALIVPQFSSLDITTELGKMLVRHNEIAVIPRGIRYRVTLPDGKPCRGYICELYQGHFRLPELGMIGTTGLANSYDFRIPKATFEGRVEKGPNGDQIAVANETSEWSIVSRLNTKLWRCSQPTTHFNVVGRQGTPYSYKYDLARVDTIANIRYGHADPSVFVVLTAPLFGKAPGTAVIDFACVGPRWQVAKGTHPLPRFHRNTMQEFVLGIIDDQRLDTPLNDPKPEQFAQQSTWSGSSHAKISRGYLYNKPKIFEPRMFKFE